MPRRAGLRFGEVLPEKPYGVWVRCSPTGEGYLLDFSRIATERRLHIPWAIWKAVTRNRRGDRLDWPTGLLSYPLRGLAEGRESGASLVRVTPLLPGQELYRPLCRPLPVAREPGIRDWVMRLYGLTRGELQQALDHYPVRPKLAAQRMLDLALHLLEAQPQAEPPGDPLLRQPWCPERDWIYAPHPAPLAAVLAGDIHMAEAGLMPASAMNPLNTGVCP